MSADLGRAYRRLLRAYPRGPRRDELLDTLLDAASPGQRRPTAREAVNLIRYGLRARLGYPRTSTVVVLSVLAALAGAYFGGAAAHRLGLEFFSATPPAAVTAELTRTVFPGQHVWGGGEAEPIVEQGDGEGIEYGYVTYWLRHRDATTRDVPGYSTAAVDRLTAAGWEVHDYLYEPPTPMVDRGESSGATFWATRDGLVVGYANYLYSGMPAYDGDGGLTLTVRQETPPRLLWIARAGALLGFVLTWFLAAWVSRRFWAAEYSGGLPGSLTVMALVLLLPAMTLTPVPDVPGDAPWWGGLVGLGSGFLPVAAVPVVLLLLGALLLGPSPWKSVLGRGVAYLRRRPRAAGGTLLALTLLLVAGFLLPAPWSATATPPLARPDCRPAPGPPPAAPPGEVAGSRAARVYVDPSSTPDQRNLITAAIRRSWAGSDSGLIWDPASPEFRAEYCDGAEVPAAAVAGLPYFFAVELNVATDYPALLQEVDGMPGVVTVRQVRD
ncbi:hypothetical protein GCM10020358_64250 [Amorphoplanes nipponensis]|uniref:Uncharacterized protein n=1 Tax=Actinoplanes nipponensis TaxID=135950 RepID=A0A919JMY3_9ACTN|nr:hypothetical protein [Actinoplanes nipponensis]GIE52170.1 hypothetical protein Ani05nite_57040 [Actinoplanes nipponensis]